MTSEICLMNRHAIVLAADSATTVTRWNGGKREERYFKGANKIFQLSTHSPVGLMINDSASILRVPWEVVIKEFRRHLNGTSFPRVKGYAEAFFQFLNDSSTMFPQEVQDDVFISGAFTTGLSRIVSAIADLPPDSKDASEAVAKVAELLAAEVQSLSPHSSLKDADLEGLVGRVLAPLIKRFEEFNTNFPLPEDLQGFSSHLVDLVLGEPSKHFGTTGLVFAGFGDDDVFPCIAEYQSCGIIASTHISSEPETTAISHSIPAALSGFAQTGMIDTFQLGISDDVYTDIALAIAAGLERLKDEVRTALGSSKSITKAVNAADLDAVFSKAAADIRKNILSRAFEENTAPLRNVLSSLPIEEMAELAESLINLQSLKEKVTKPSETVGGPVDVAAITKAEGLVWIKRKHYFDRELNSRFAYRQMREHS